MQDIRAFSGSPSDPFKKDFIRLLEQEEKESPSFFNFKTSRAYSMLAISGGAANGAYGAGLLSGWSQSGTRPVFKVVTGISTGAIIAPFAFLGSKYDDRLKEFYTRYSTKDIVRIRVPVINSFASTRPLERLIERYFDAKLLKEIALEYNKGRRLYVGTTNLDAQRLVIWDMGKIASVGDDKALKLFRKVILASASIPIAFPPVYLSVEVDDKMYDEMHVDGGISKQVFFLYDVLQGFDKALKEKGIDVAVNKYAIYIIRNGYVEPIYREVSDKLSAIAERTVDTMANAQGIGDLYQLYFFAQGGKGDFNLAYIPATHVSKAKELFDPIEMQALFDLGFKEASQGYPWRKSPPGLGEGQRGGK
ncbi:MAG TPA: patatin-like phospholipase family protein [Candidatus Omnitrophota bacterium]|nr:patatin-like phospholipase family protein [Candidatus Omnitrophota bacterium]HPD84722.1 patatin-like phospholipase family protein [Candidatus Omnitrophota bacterium]HRZ03580.1 patatin-like phospholipase family protein [Candidatus Omnitrophota bacterium]